MICPLQILEDMMSLFVSHGKIKSTMLLNGLFASFLLIAIFAGIYSLLLQAVTTLFENLGLMAVWGPPLLLSLITVLLCQLFNLLPINKLLLPCAFTFLALYAGLLLLGVMTQIEPDGRDLALQLWAIYTIPPVLIGNGISWTVWVFNRRHRQPD